MPKSLTEVLKRELSKHEIELLDIYVFKKKDLLRLLDKRTNRVILYELPKKLSSITSIDDIKELGSEIVKNVQKS
ncbi:MAG: hypothetical protein LM567_04610 [Desulfurococcaceae archaeon]|jgi:hypothetical protein|nr:hypothetical protein [Desulfurococcaceae archaeon]